MESPHRLVFSPVCSGKESRYHYVFVILSFGFYVFTPDGVSLAQLPQNWLLSRTILYCIYHGFLASAGVLEPHVHVFHSFIRPCIHQKRKEKELSSVGILGLERLSRDDGCMMDISGWKSS